MTQKEKLQANRFYHRAVQYLREEFPQAASMNEDELKDAIFSGCQKALSYGFETEADAMGFVDLQWRISPSFDTDTETFWAKDVLNDNDLDAEMKLATLRNAFALTEAMKEDAT